MKYLKTYIYLPPGLPPLTRVREFLRRALEEYRWFRPTRFGLAFPEERLDPEHLDYEVLLTFYDDLKALCVAAPTDRDFFLIHPARPDVPPHTGAIIWRTSIREAVKASWRTEHMRQVLELMRLMGSPLAQSAVDDDFERKTRRLVPAADGLGSEESSTVRDPSEGLAGLFWRNFFGPPFVSMFGERLDTLPGEFKQDLGQGTILVQPYALPTQAGTPEGAEHERQLIAHLGADCFYDHTRHSLPPRRPALSPGGSPR
ncbi:hypothetical protein [Hyalangium rubrum]|uniref:Uncharacterized protein n=1 Tax=Hyalangium rubrum TaxID=3103134 RepID=A0ABU5H4N2_9BACT|nr:hypothetical protein [Hyalangium sp. s54d21]MDY7227742.1 hypothetical protein [Hyalangium sp. s54d21]